MGTDRAVLNNLLTLSTFSIWSLIIINYQQLPTYIIPFIQLSSCCSEGRGRWVNKINKLNITMNLEEEREVQLQVQCRDGPIRERRCTDWGCCLFYFVLIAVIAAFAIINSQRPQISTTVLDNLLKHNGAALPFLSTYKVMPYILTSWAIATGLCLVIVITIYLIPAIAAYLFIPIMLVMMLLMGVGFIYRFFGKHLPFVPRSVQTTYVASYNTASLVIGILLVVGFVVSLIVVLTRQQRIKFIYSLLRLAKICFWDNIYLFGVSILLSGISIGLMFLNIFVITLSIKKVNGNHVHYDWPYIILVLF